MHLSLPFDAPVSTILNRHDLAVERGRERGRNHTAPDLLGFRKRGARSERPLFLNLFCFSPFRALQVSFLFLFPAEGEGTGDAGAAGRNESKVKSGEKRKKGILPLLFRKFTNTG